MKQYLQLLRHIVENGIDKEDRTGVGTRSVFGYQMRFNLQDGFPLVTTRKIYTRSLIYELLWFLKGEDNLQYLWDNNVHFWDSWSVNEKGYVPNIYPKQWRRWEGADGKIYDQVVNVINQIKENPNSRRHIINCWKVEEIESMALPPCHYSINFDVTNNKLNCLVSVRSNDIPVGNPTNIAFYALFTHMIAQVCDLDVGDLVLSIANAHVYQDQLSLVKEQLKRSPLPLPILKLNPEIKNIDDFTYDDIKIVGYNHHPVIKYPVAV